MEKSPNSAEPVKRRGAPKKVLNAGMIQIMAMKGLTQEDISAVLGCSADTIYRNYAGAFAIGRQKCMSSLRRKQFEMAMKGDRTMLVWLGKNLLGQKDRHELTGKDDSPLMPEVDREELIGKLLGTGSTPTAKGIQ